MKKIIVLMTSLLLLTGCVKVSFTGPKKEEKTSQSTSSKKEPPHICQSRPVQRSGQRSPGSI